MIWTIGGTILALCFAAHLWARLIRRQQHRSYRHEQRGSAASHWVRHHY